MALSKVEQRSRGDSGEGDSRYLPARTCECGAGGIAILGGFPVGGVAILVHRVAPMCPRMFGPTMRV